VCRVLPELLTARGDSQPTRNTTDIDGGKIRSEISAQGQGLHERPSGRGTGVRLVPEEGMILGSSTAGKKKAVGVAS